MDEETHKCEVTPHHHRHRPCTPVYARISKVCINTKICMYINFNKFNEMHYTKTNQFTNLISQHIYIYIGRTLHQTNAHQKATLRIAY